jgi:hypothetical protein
MFFCNWVKKNYTGSSTTIKRDEYGFTLENFNSLISISAQSFAFPIHVEQVFFSINPKDTTTTRGYFAIHISSQTTKKEVSESPPLRTIILRKLLSFCDTITFALVQSQVLHNSWTWYNHKTFLIIIASIYCLWLTLHQKLFVTNPSSQRLSESTQKSIDF